MKKYECFEETLSAQEMQARSELAISDLRGNLQPSPSDSLFVVTYGNTRELPDFVRGAVANGATMVTVEFATNWHQSRAAVSLRYASDLTELMLKVSDGITRNSPVYCEMVIGTRPYKLGF